MKKTAPFLMIKAARLLKTNLNERREGKREAALFQLLAIIADRPFNVLELAEKLHCSKQEASRLVKAAEGDSWVSVIPSANDKRVKMVFISKEGRSLLKEGFDTYETRDIEIRKLLGEGEYKSFKRSLEKLCETAQ